MQHEEGATFAWSHGCVMLGKSERGANGCRRSYGLAWGGVLCQANSWVVRLVGCWGGVAARSFMRWCRCASRMRKGLAGATCLARWANWPNLLGLRMQGR